MSSTPLGQMLIAAVEDGGRLWEIKNLIDDGAPLNETDTKGDTALIKAASKNDFELVAILLNAGCDPNITDRDGNTALIRTIEFVKDKAAAEKIVYALLTYGASVTILRNDQDKHAVDYAKQWQQYKADCTVWDNIWKRACEEVGNDIVEALKNGNDTTPSSGDNTLQTSAVPDQTRHRNLRNYIKKGMKK